MTLKQILYHDHNFAILNVIIYASTLYSNALLSYTNITLFYGRTCHRNMEYFLFIETRNRQDTKVVKEDY